MKQRIQWVVGLFTVASASLALGCGCASERPLQPVREVIVQQQPICATESRSLDWGAPFRTVGHVISAPFIALGRAFGPSDRYAEPVGERFTTYSRNYCAPAFSSTMLAPVGERITTVKTIRYEPMLQPVGERVIWVKHHHKMLKPVGERFISEKRYHRTYVQPVGEKFIKEKRYHKALTKPVGEKITIEKNKMLLKSGGQKTNWQKSKAL